MDRALTLTTFQVKNSQTTTKLTARRSEPSWQNVLKKAIYHSEKATYSIPLTTKHIKKVAVITMLINHLINKNVRKLLKKLEEPNQTLFSVKTNLIMFQSIGTHLCSPTSQTM